MNVEPEEVLQKMTQKRMTRQRKAILENLKDRKDHPTASEIYIQVRGRIPQVSLGTIYRNLNVLQELGEVQEINVNNNFKRYDGNPEQHYHFFCRDCGNVYDLKGSYQEELDQLFSRKNAHYISGHNADFFGTCCNCINST